MDDNKKQLRQKLCAAISQNVLVTDHQKFDVIMESLYEDCESTIETDTVNDSLIDEKQLSGVSNITPLMVACDKSIELPLIHLKNKIKELQMQSEDNPDHNSRSTMFHNLAKLWGHPLETSSTKEGANSAAHHAIASGFIFGLNVLEHFNRVISFYDDNHNKANRLQAFDSLITQTNGNGDTPIMMACVFGHTSVLNYILQRRLELSADELDELPFNAQKEDSTIQSIWQPLQIFFAIQNEEGCTALTLSCGHGKVEVVQMLIQPLFAQITWSDNECKAIVSLDNYSERENEDLDEADKRTYKLCLKPLLKVSHKDLEHCKSALKGMDAEVNHMKQHKSINNAHLNEFFKQRLKLCECEQLLNEVMNYMVADVAKDLMNDKNFEVSTPNQHATKAKKKKKKHKGRNKMLILDRISNEANQDNTPDKDESEREPANPFNRDPSPFITLQDGRLISRTQQANDMDAVVQNNVDFVPSENSAPRSLQSVLQSQLRKKPQTRERSTKSCPESFNVEAQMESLCLEPSMLLLSSHGMAMEMSPCQLETMQAILQHQVNAAHEAQIIQERLLSQEQTRPTKAKSHNELP
eukprot:scaffold157100_cov83-Cyclotella_meneghiniana.AAC.1